MLSVKRIFCATVFAASVGLVGCEGETGGDTNEAPKKLVVPAHYEFQSRFGDESSVSYGGQTLRQVLITDLAAYWEGLTARESTPDYAPTTTNVVASLNFYYAFDGETAAETKILLETDPAALQATLGELSKSANLSSKIAGKDEPEKQNKDWATEFIGGEPFGVSTPDGLIQYLFERGAALAVTRATYGPVKDPFGGDIEAAYITQEGYHLVELAEKFLAGAVAYSQAIDDYLDEGLDADNTAAVEGKPYTQLEHHWDEAFGYLGASRDFGTYTPEEIREDRHRDTNGDGKIDLTSEMTFSTAAYLASRDRGSAEGAKTDFAKTIMTAFLTGRAIITWANGALSPQQRAELEAQRDIIAANWDKATAASAVHYLNELIADGEKLKAGTDYSFSSHAAHWSELKGFALSLQFNPRKLISDAQLAALHEKIGSGPVFEEAKLDAYKARLLEARQILGDAYAFDAANLGGENGEGGW